MTRPTPDDALLDWASDALDPDARAQVDAALADDPVAAREAALLRRIVDEASALPLPEPSAALAQNVLRAARVEAPVPGGLWQRLTQNAWFGTLAVAALSVAVAAIVFRVAALPGASEHSVPASSQETMARDIMARATEAEADDDDRAEPAAQGAAALPRMAAPPSPQPLEEAEAAPAAPTLRDEAARDGIGSAADALRAAEPMAERGATGTTRTQAPVSAERTTAARPAATASPGEVAARERRMEAAAPARPALQPPAPVAPVPAQPPAPARANADIADQRAALAEAPSPAAAPMDEDRVRLEREVPRESQRFAAEAFAAEAIAADEAADHDAPADRLETRVARRRPAMDTEGAMGTGRAGAESVARGRAEPGRAAEANAAPSSASAAAPAGAAASGGGAAAAPPRRDAAPDASADAIASRADEAARRGDAAAAVGLYRQALAVDRAHPSCLGLGRALRALGRTAEAREAFRTCAARGADAPTRAAAQREADALPAD